MQQELRQMSLSLAPSTTTENELFQALEINGDLIRSMFPTASISSRSSPSLLSSRPSSASKPEGRSTSVTPPSLRKSGSIPSFAGHSKNTEPRTVALPETVRRPGSRSASVSLVDSTVDCLEEDLDSTFDSGPDSKIHFVPLLPPQKSPQRPASAAHPISSRRSYPPRMALSRSLPTASSSATPVDRWLASRRPMSPGQRPQRPQTPGDLPDSPTKRQPKLESLDSFVSVSSGRSSPGQGHHRQRISGQRFKFDWVLVKIIGEQFRQLDKDGHGLVPVAAFKEFVHAFQRQTLDLDGVANPFQDCELLFDESEAPISFEEICKSMFPKASKRDLQDMRELVYIPKPPSYAARIADEITPKLSAKQLHEIKEIFDRYDLDGDGTISIEELFQAMPDGISTSVYQKHEEVLKMFEQLDINHDRQVSLDEFIKFLEPNYLLGETMFKTEAAVREFERPNGERPRRSSFNYNRLVYGGVPITEAKPVMDYS
eukprot:TRINITY_DN30810_c0_g1_i1.p1 TRINITY_DN30810_c0_g1~~TRINITY_DN30810_c0_g1_i1.p1  ORF type:complete len:487 (+),score=135.31 TRINITY_DN30810_c0_g1_i1:66-1526(+)